MFAEDSEYDKRSQHEKKLGHGDEPGVVHIYIYTTSELSQCSGLWHKSLRAED